MVRLRFGKNRALARDLETARFVLRSTGPIAAIRLTASWRTDPEILRGIYQSGKPRSLLDWIRVGPSPDNLQRFGWAIIPKGTTTPIGFHLVRLTDYRSANNLVGLHDRTWWGKDVVLEVRAKLINHFFAHSAVDRFDGGTISTNTASIFNYRRLGFTHVGTRHRVSHDPTTGKVSDMLAFELLRETWQAGPYFEPTP